MGTPLERESQYYLSVKESRYQSLYDWQLEHPQKTPP